jgi:hypothetical protein
MKKEKKLVDKLFDLIIEHDSQLQGAQNLRK